MRIQILEPENEQGAVYRSRAMQDRGKLSVLRGNAWVPISFDELDYIGCDGIHSHLSTVTDKVDDYYDQTCYFATIPGAGDISDDPDGMTILEPEKEQGALYRSPAMQNRNKLSQLRGNIWMPISYDSLDFIGCDGAHSHRAVVTDKYDEGYERRCYYATLPTLCDISQDGPEMSILPSQDAISVRYHSSISQHRNKLSTMRGNMWTPISYDVLDYVGCDGVASHKAIVTDGDDIGFNFDVDMQCYFTDDYVLHDTQGVRMVKMPHWFGEGFYEEYYNKEAFVNADDGALGVHNAKQVPIGLSYALADQTLEADED